MATGDAALAAGMDLVDGNSPANTLATEDNKTRDYIAQRTNAITPVAKGGTGADNAEAARANLGLVKWASSADADGKVPMYHSGGRIAVARPTSNGHASDKEYVDDIYNLLNSSKLPTAGGTITGSLFLPNAVPATSGYAVAYINGDGRLAKNASSERYKKHITEIDPGQLGDIWPQLHRYQMRNGDGSWKYGYIAERLAESDDLRPFVVYRTESTTDPETGLTEVSLVLDRDGGDPVPESIDFIALLMAQNAQLHQAVELLTQRLDALEARDEPA